MSRAYDASFMAYADQSSRYAAQQVATLLRASLALSSVLDIGCARGTWLQAWAALGAAEVQGVDGDYVDRATLQIPVEHFRAHDLSQPLDLGRRFDLVQSLEVAEHVPASAAEVFVENLCRHSGGCVLFSAAPPGQGGEFHVNEQPYDYWRERFRAHGYLAHDYLRPRILGDTAISFWYRFNLFLYVREDRRAGLPLDIAASAVADGTPLADVSPPLFRLRKRVVRMLPPALSDGLARFKARYAPSGRW